ncbi:hypothetical protein TVAG_068380 [Trichomonas vaginalis G3]|uniref:Uncharacterized protein n=1 Tax=Trichomonas vaginalis (strain ATCC PRA-98 / G3) TaxID=412133 RepID=A2FL44_TRIV3|nr:hypothetical protein TVAGG3_0846960 [Trichomonas vaginalis G3]EAX94370.1 hypothetical protein TVAG_068380 [Trichomonas vaginalis G3]KAI5499689.1 hypothetical protein TVAGG3_0846960 [Trichomonas vaginalis G3]|eukprot:XP_001307300.1 hypothetical protein [Trichomonas vaginalis G3]
MLFFFLYYVKSNLFTVNQIDQETKVFQPLYNGNPITQFGIKSEIYAVDMKFKYNISHDEEIFYKGIDIKTEVTFPENENSIFLNFTFQSNYTVNREFSFYIYGEAPFSDDFSTDIITFAGIQGYTYKERNSNRNIIISADRNTPPNYFYHNILGDSFDENIRSFNTRNTCFHHSLLSNISSWVLGWNRYILEPYQTLQFRLIITDDTNLEPTPTISVDKTIANPNNLFPITVIPTKSNTLYFIESYRGSEGYTSRLILGNFTSKEAGVAETINISFYGHPSSDIRKIFVYSQFSANSEPVYITISSKEESFDIISPPQSHIINYGTINMKFNTTSSSRNIYCIYNDAFEDKFYYYSNQENGIYYIIFRIPYDKKYLRNGENIVRFFVSGANTELKSFNIIIDYFHQLDISSPMSYNRIATKISMNATVNMTIKSPPNNIITLIYRYYDMNGPVYNEITNFTIGNSNTEIQYQHILHIDPSKRQLDSLQTEGFEIRDIYGASHYFNFYVIVELPSLEFYSYRSGYRIAAERGNYFNFSGQLDGFTPNTIFNIAYGKANSGNMMNYYTRKLKDESSYNTKSSNKSKQSRIVKQNEYPYEYSDNFIHIESYPCFETSEPIEYTTLSYSVTTQDSYKSEYFNISDQISQESPEYVVYFVNATSQDRSISICKYFSVNIQTRPEILSASLLDNIITIGQPLILNMSFNSTDFAELEISINNSYFSYANYHYSSDLCHIEFPFMILANVANYTAQLIEGPLNEEIARHIIPGNYDLSIRLTTDGGIKSNVFHFQFTISDQILPQFEIYFYSDEMIFPLGNIAMEIGMFRLLPCNVTLHGSWDGQESFTIHTIDLYEMMEYRNSIVFSTPETEGQHTLYLWLTTDTGYKSIQNLTYSMEFMEEESATETTPRNTDVEENPDPEFTPEPTPDPTPLPTPNPSIECNNLASYTQADNELSFSCDVEGLAVNQTIILMTTFLGDNGDVYYKNFTDPSFRSNDNNYYHIEFKADVRFVARYTIGWINVSATDEITTTPVWRDYIHIVPIARFNSLGISKTEVSYGESFDIVANVSTSSLISAYIYYYFDNDIKSRQTFSIQMSGETYNFTKTFSTNNLFHCGLHNISLSFGLGKYRDEQVFNFTILDNHLPYIKIIPKYTGTKFFMSNSSAKYEIQCMDFNYDQENRIYVVADRNLPELVATVSPNRTFVNIEYQYYYPMISAHHTLKFYSNDSTGAQSNIITIEFDVDITPSVCIVNFPNQKYFEVNSYFIVDLYFFNYNPGSIVNVFYYLDKTIKIPENITIFDNFSSPITSINITTINYPDDRWLEIYGQDNTGVYSNKTKLRVLIDMKPIISYIQPLKEEYSVGEVISFNVLGMGTGYCELHYKYDDMSWEAFNYESSHGRFVWINRTLQARYATREYLISLKMVDTYDVESDIYNFSFRVNERHSPTLSVSNYVWRNEIIYFYQDIKFICTINDQDVGNIVDLSFSINNSEFSSIYNYISDGREKVIEYYYTGPRKDGYTKFAFKVTDNTDISKSYEKFINLRRGLGFQYTQLTNQRIFEGGEALPFTGFIHDYEPNTNVSLYYSFENGNPIQISDYVIIGSNYRSPNITFNITIPNNYGSHRINFHVLKQGEQQFSTFNSVGYDVNKPPIFIDWVSFDKPHYNNSFIIINSTIYDERHVELFYRFNSDPFKDSPGGYNFDGVSNKTIVYHCPLPNNLEQGINTISVYFKDNYNNISETKTQEFIYDSRTAPVIQVYNEKTSNYGFYENITLSVSVFDEAVENIINVTLFLDNEIPILVYSAKSDGIVHNFTYSSPVPRSNGYHYYTFSAVNSIGAESLNVTKEINNNCISDYFIFII